MESHEEAGQWSVRSGFLGRHELACKRPRGRGRNQPKRISLIKAGVKKRIVEENEDVEEVSRPKKLKKNKEIVHKAGHEKAMGRPGNVFICILLFISKRHLYL